MLKAWIKLFEIKKSGSKEDETKLRTSPCNFNVLFVSGGVLMISTWSIRLVCLVKGDVIKQKCNANASVLFSNACLNIHSYKGKAITWYKDTSGYTASLIV